MLRFYVLGYISIYIYIYTSEGFIARVLISVKVPCLLLCWDLRLSYERLHCG